MTYRIEGVDGPWTVLSGTMYRPPVTVRRASVYLPGQHGSMPAGGVLFDEPILTFEFLVEGATPAALELNVQSFVSLLSRPGDLVVTRLVGGQTHEASGRLVSMSDPEFYPAGNAVVIDVTVALPGVFFRPPAPSTSTLIEAGMSVSGAPVSSVTGSTAPVTDAVVRVTGPLTYIQVTDDLTGTGLSWAGTLTASQYVYLDAGALTARVSTSSSAWSSGGSVANSGLDYPPAGPLVLWTGPHEGDVTDRRATISLTGTGMTSATAVAVRARRSYL